MGDDQSQFAISGFPESSQRFGMESVELSCQLPVSSAVVRIPASQDAQERKKLSIVLSKEMHRRAKMQALEEDVTLRDLIVRLISNYLENPQSCVE